ncbi:DUF1015 domain-containing protein [Sphingobacteriales bacterium CHB3]|nr:DUF1015 domain-containing protein [Sphingobacteriales bacterium CHB3]
MATVRPFKGFRPLPQYAAQVAAKPYDVLSSEEARIEAQGKPLSFLHVGKPEIDLPPGTDLYDPAVYEKGKENLQKLIRDGILKEDPHPYFYVYAQTMGNHTQYGIIGCASVQEYLNDTIKKHELTRKDKEDDRTRHVKVTNAHTGPIFLTYHAEPRIDAIVDRVRLVDPTYNFVADDGIRHQLWVISDERLIRQLVEHFGRVNYLYVADGHHRSAAAARVGKEIADANPNHKGDEEYNFFLAVLFPHNQLRIMEYNRVVKDLNGLTEDAFLEEIKKHKFTISRTGQVQPKVKGEYGMYLNGHWYTLKADLSYLTNPDPVEKLDVSILQKNILAPILGIDDPRTNKRIDFVGGIRGIKELEKRVNSGEMAVAFALYPTSIEELLTIADAGKIMPPKSTWFEPKLRDGVVVHFLS